MKSLHRPAHGQSIVEAVLLLPVLLILLGGAYWIYRDLSLASAAESGAHAQMLRAGRRLGGIEPRLSGSILPGGDAVRFEAHNDPLVGEVPLFRGLPGRTIASADVTLGKEPVGAFLDLPSHVLRKEAEGAVDCWGRGTPPGSTIRRTVQGILLTGVGR